MEKCWQVLALRKLLFMTVAIIVVSLIRKVNIQEPFYLPSFTVFGGVYSVISMLRKLIILQR